MVYILLKLRKYSAKTQFGGHIGSHFEFLKFLNDVGEISFILFNRKSHPSSESMLQTVYIV